MEIKIMRPNENNSWTDEDFNLFLEQVNKLFVAGLYAEEAEMVIFGELTFEDAIRICNEDRALRERLNEEIEYVKADTAEEIQKVLDECNRISKERLEKGLY